MTIANIVEELDAEIARLQQVRKLLWNGSRLNVTSFPAVDGAATQKRAKRKKRTVSPEARQRMAEAQRKRWAAQKKAAK